MLYDKQRTSQVASSWHENDLAAGGARPKCWEPRESTGCLMSLYETACQKAGMLVAFAPGWSKGDV